MYKSIRAVNQAFRAYAKENNILVKRGKPQNEQITDTRLQYIDFVNSADCSEYIRTNAHYF